MGDKRKLKEAKRAARKARTARAQRPSAAGVTRSAMPRLAADLMNSFGRDERMIIAGEQEVAGEILAQADPQRVLKAAGNALAFGDLFVEKHLKVVPGQSTAACKQGCSWCCYLRVETSVPEVLVIAEYVRSMLPVSEQEGLAARVAELAADRRIFSVDDKPKNRIPCALLNEDGTCKAYLARPLACRGWNSMDADSCRRALDDDEAAETDVGLVNACLAIGIGFGSALRDAGLSANTVELTSGLHIALTQPNALKQWESGEPVFAPAAIDGSGFRE